MTFAARPVVAVKRLFSAVWRELWSCLFSALSRFRRVPFPARVLAFSFPLLLLRAGGAFVLPQGCPRVVVGAVLPESRGRAESRAAAC